MCVRLVTELCGLIKRLNSQNKKSSTSSCFFHFRRILSGLETLIKVNPALSQKGGQFGIAGGGAILCYLIESRLPEVGNPSL